jgi:hypothetical protein
VKKCLGCLQEKPLTEFYKCASVTEEELHSKYQLLCANCNFIKRITHSEQRKGTKNRVLKFWKEKGLATSERG